MKKVTVYHLDREGFSNSHMVVNEDKRVAFAKKELNDGGYDAVISYLTSTDDALNDAYRQTNSIEYYWGDNFGEVDEKFRSTSVCDIIEVDDIKYMVAGCGFKRITPMTTVELIAKYKAEIEDLRLLINESDVVDINSRYSIGYRYSISALEGVIKDLEEL